jgi:23S rRNA (uracil1939-C5)-methyltransferase
LLDKLTTLVLVTQPSLADISYGEVTTYLKGSELTQDVTVDGKTFVFTYGPQSFFQANVTVFEIVLKDMREWASKLDSVETVYDLYGGVGSIGVALAEYGAKLVSVDISKENTDYFMKNAAQNGVKQAEVVNGTVESYLDANELTENSIAIIDPPRVGMEPKIVEKFLAQKNLPKAIIYMSCNPNSQAADIKLLEGKYQLESVTAYDMFPHATHLEAVAFLKRR